MRFNAWVRLYEGNYQNNYYYHHIEITANSREEAQQKLKEHMDKLGKWELIKFEYVYSI